MKSFINPIRSLGRLLAYLLPAVCIAQTAPPSPDSNAVWIAREYVTQPEHVRLVPDMATHFKDLGIKYIFVNTAFFSKTGGTDVVSRQLTPFLDEIGRWEAANHYTFVVLLWLNGTVDKEKPRCIDIAQPDLRRALVDESMRYMDAAVKGSYIAGTKRPNDGVMIDIEPAGGDPVLFKNLNTLMQEIKQAAGPSRKIGFAAHKIGNLGIWQFSEVYYHYLARNVDYIASMTYNSGKKTPEDYQDWMKMQTRNVLRAVSGAAWNNDANHPAPTNGVKVFIGLSVYPTDPINHRAGIEVIQAGAAGIKEGLAELDDASRSYFEGAHLYAHSDGVSDDGYAKWTTDWEDFRTFWLKP
jgi:hypothetical protein